MTEPVTPPYPPNAPKPSGYEQGYRDGLLTARSALLASSEVDVARRALEQLIDSKNQDLWNLMSLVLVTSPESAALRAQLRGPFGAGIDSEGRVLFLRVPNPPNSPIEYDTGVLALLERVRELEDNLSLLSQSHESGAAHP